MAVINLLNNLARLSTDPLLSSPPAFVLLAGMVALGAYLRALGEARVKLIDEIEAGRSSDFPIGAAHTENKLAHLKQSGRLVNNLVAPGVIWLTVLLVAGLLALAVVRLKFPDNPDSATIYFRWFDLGFMGFLMVLFLALTMMHHVGMWRDARIRLRISGYKDSQKRPTGGRPGDDK